MTNTTGTQMPTLLDVEGVAAYLKVSTKHVYTLINERQIKAVKIGQSWKMRDTDVAEYVNGLFER